MGDVAKVVMIININKFSPLYYFFDTFDLKKSQKKQLRYLVAFFNL